MGGGGRLGRVEVYKLVKDWTINDSYYLVGIMREPNLARLDKAVENARKKKVYTELD